MSAVRTKVVAGIMSGVVVAAGTVALAAPSGADEAASRIQIVEGVCAGGSRLTLESVTRDGEQHVTVTASGLDDGEKRNIILVGLPEDPGEDSGSDPKFYRFSRTARDGGFTVEANFPGDYPEVNARSRDSDGPRCAVDVYQGRPARALSSSDLTRILFMRVRRTSGPKHELAIAGAGAPFANWDLTIIVRRSNGLHAVSTAAARGMKDGFFSQTVSLRLRDRAKVTVIAQRPSGRGQQVSLDRSW